MRALRAGSAEGGEVRLIKLTTVSAVSPFDPLAIANLVLAVFGIWCAR